MRETSAKRVYRSSCLYDSGGSSRGSFDKTGQLVRSAVPQLAAAATLQLLFLGRAGLVLGALVKSSFRKAITSTT